MDVRYVDRSRTTAGPERTWLAHSREFELTEGDEVLGWGLLTLHDISSGKMGVEVGPFLAVDWVEVFKPHRRRTKPIASIIEFIVDEAMSLIVEKRITGVGFDPWNDSIQKFVESRIRFETIGQPPWIFIPAAALVSDGLKAQE